jgi:branched-chain amino acid transport system substrate-binding protein
MTQKNETPILLLSLLITFACLGAGLWWLSQQFPQLFCLLNGSSCQGNNNFNSQQGKEISAGAVILFPTDSTAAKKAGIIAFEQKNYEEAIEQFQASLRILKNDPESLIYLNNAKAASGNPLKIAVIIPIGGNLNIAKEILRGVAQAQNEINNTIGIEGRLLQVVIANDNNVPDKSRKIAQQLIADQEILGVVGHNASEASIAAAPVYQEAGLVMISPTSKAKEVAEVGNFIFRTVPSYKLEADLLSRYSIDRLKKKNLVFCNDFSAKDTQSLKQDFATAVQENGGRLIDINCDLSANDFDPSNLITSTIAQGGEGILLAPSVNKLNPAIELIDANQRRLTLLASSTLYTFQTLQQGGGNANGLVIAVPWHPDALTNNPFAGAARKLWNGEVNWRTALAYDATKAIITALKTSTPSRQDLQKRLANSNFSFIGATGKIQFSASGERKGEAILIQVKPGNKSNTGFDFYPLNR